MTANSTETNSTVTDGAESGKKETRKRFIKFETLSEYSHQGVSAGYCMILSIAILLPFFYYSIWQLHFCQVLYHWHRKGSLVKEA